MIFEDDKNLNSNHNRASEMTVKSQNQYKDIVIDWLETQNDHIWTSYLTLYMTLNWRSISNHSYELKMIYGGYDYS